MARLILGVWWFAITLLLCIPDSRSEENITNIIESAMLALSQKIMKSSNIINGHKDYVKYVLPKIEVMLKNVYNNTSELGPLNNITSEIGNKLAHVETMLIHEEERGNSSQKETNEELKDIKDSIERLTSTVQSKTPGAVESRKDFIEGRLNSTDSKIDELRNQMENLTKNFNKDTVRTMCLGVIDMSPFAKHIETAEKLLERYELKLDEYRNNSEKINVVARVENRRYDDIMNELRRQGEEIAKVQNSLSTAEGTWKEMPKLSDLHELQASTNKTMEAVIRAADNLNENTQASMTNLTRHLGELSGRIVATNSTVQRSVKEIMQINIVINDITRGLGKLHEQMSLNDRKMIQIDDGVKGNKKAIATATNRVVAENIQLIANLGFSVNGTLIDKLEEIENSMRNKQSDSNSKLEARIEEEMKRLWLQFGTIDRQLRENKAALGNLTRETHIYTDKSGTIMDELADKVTKISDRTVVIGDALDNTMVKMRRTAEEFRNLTNDLIEVIPSIITSELAKLGAEPDSEK